MHSLDFLLRFAVAFVKLEPAIWYAFRLGQGNLCVGAREAGGSESAEAH